MGLKKFFESFGEVDDFDDYDDIEEYSENEDFEDIDDIEAYDELDAIEDIEYIKDEDKIDDPKLAEKHRKMKKVEIIAALILAAVLIITIPIFSWFVYQNRLAKLAKIKAPDDLYINAAHREDKINLDMRTIDVTQTYKSGDTDVPIKSQNFVFSVSGNYVNRFTLQMEHTTNNPYKYKIYEGTVYKVTKDASGNIQSIINVKTGKTIQEDGHSDYNTRRPDGSLKYVEYIATGDYDTEEMSKVSFPTEAVEVNRGDTLYIYVGDEVKNIAGETGAYLNKAPGARIDDGTLTPKSYDDYETFNMFADPVYWQLRRMRGAPQGEKKAFYNTYVVNVSWDGVQDITRYNKETDIIYISAFVE